MGAVYEAIHLETRRRVALKVMLPILLGDDDLRERFAREACVTSEIVSEHLVQIFDAGVDEATQMPFLVMELLRGEDLATVLEQRGRLPASEVALIFRQVALALDKTHAAGIVHRDLKPENLFLTKRDDGSPWMKVLDFGVAKIVAQSSAAKTTRVAGTPLYMAPEQMRGVKTIGPRADIYAMGHIGYALLVGQPYWWPEFQDNPASYPFMSVVLEGVKESAIDRARSVGVMLPRAFNHWFVVSTAQAPENRFADVSEQAAELAAALGVSEPGDDDRRAPETTDAASDPQTESTARLHPPSWLAGDKASEVRSDPSAVGSSIEDEPTTRIRRPSDPADVSTAREAPGQVAKEKKTQLSPVYDEPHLARRSTSTPEIELRQSSDESGADLVAVVPGAMRSDSSKDADPTATPGTGSAPAADSSDASDPGHARTMISGPGDSGPEESSPSAVTSATALLPAEAESDQVPTPLMQANQGSAVEQPVFHPVGLTTAPQAPGQGARRGPAKLLVTLTVGVAAAITAFFVARWAVAPDLSPSASATATATTAPVLSATTTVAGSGSIATSTETAGADAERTDANAGVETGADASARTDPPSSRPIVNSRRPSVGPGGSSTEKATSLPVTSSSSTSSLPSILTIR